MIQFDNVKIFTDDIEDTALEQIRELNSTKIFGDNPIRIMPDVHAGAGCVIGFTVPVTDKIIPNLVGVDIGCGVLSVRINGNVVLDRGIDDLQKLDDVIHKVVPSGRNVHDNIDSSLTDWVRDEIIEQLRCKDYITNTDWLCHSLGTLGGGNHFIELDEGELGAQYLTIHSGSRNIGKQVAEYYQKLAIKKCNAMDVKSVIDSLKVQGRETEIQNAIQQLKAQKPKIPNGLCYLEGQDMQDYLHDVKICQEFAHRNRIRIALNIINEYFTNVQNDFDYIETLHNYIADDNIIRKGAIKASKGKRVIIPLNMRDGCIIGIGKGNQDWNCSAPHGAGRKMSRHEARESIAMEDYKESMKSIYSTSVSEETIDEAPFAYKPSNEIIKLVEETVDIKDIIKPIYNYKAKE